jgi:hypothetical protein
MELERSCYTPFRFGVEEAHKAIHVFLSALSLHSFLEVSQRMKAIQALISHYCISFFHVQQSTTL